MKPKVYIMKATEGHVQLQMMPNRGKVWLRVDDIRRIMPMAEKQDTPVFTDRCAIVMADGNVFGVAGTTDTVAVLIGWGVRS